MRTIIDNPSETYYAKNELETKRFIGELIMLCQKHNLIIVPRGYDNEVNLHDSMLVVNLTKEFVEYLKDRTAVGFMAGFN